MRLLFLALFASFTFVFASCSRAPNATETDPAAKAVKTEAKNDALMATDDYGEELITRLKRKGGVSVEQEAQIRKIWSGYSLEGADAEKRRSVLNEFRSEVKRNIPDLFN